MKLPKEIRNIIAGGIAGMVAKSFVAPFERIKILYQISSARFQITQVPTVAMNIVKAEGMTALWKGNSATMIRVFPYSGIQFMVYDRCKTFLLREQEMEYARRKTLDPKAPKPNWGLTPKESLFSGMIAGVISVIFTYPLDMTRAQLAVLKRHKDSSTNMSFVKVINENYRNRVRIFALSVDVKRFQGMLMDLIVLSTGSAWTLSRYYSNDAGDSTVFRNRLYSQ